MPTINTNINTPIQDSDITEEERALFQQALDQGLFDTNMSEKSQPTPDPMHAERSDYSQIPGIALKGNQTQEDIDQWNKTKRRKEDEVKSTSQIFYEQDPNHLYPSQGDINETTASFDSLLKEDLGLSNKTAENLTGALGYTLNQGAGAFRATFTAFDYALAGVPSAINVLTNTIEPEINANPWLMKAVDLASATTGIVKSPLMKGLGEFGKKAGGLVKVKDYGSAGFSLEEIIKLMPKHALKNAVNTTPFLLASTPKDEFKRLITGEQSVKSALGRRAITAGVGGVITGLLTAPFSTVTNVVGNLHKKSPELADKTLTFLQKTKQSLENFYERNLEQVKDPLKIDKELNKIREYVAKSPRMKQYYEGLREWEEIFNSKEPIKNLKAYSKKVQDLVTVVRKNADAYNPAEKPYAEQQFLKLIDGVKEKLNQKGGMELASKVYEKRTAKIEAVAEVLNIKPKDLTRLKTGEPLVQSKILKGIRNYNADKVLFNNLKDIYGEKMIKEMGGYAKMAALTSNVLPLVSRITQGYIVYFLAGKIIKAMGVNRGQDEQLGARNFSYQN